MSLQDYLHLNCVLHHLAMAEYFGATVKVPGMTVVVAFTACVVQLQHSMPTL